MSEVLNATKRDELGTRETRRLRRQGGVPAVLYGHGEENVNLTLPVGEVDAALRHGAKLVEIRGVVAENALIRDVQWDALGNDILHLDLTRVSAEEAVVVTVAVELRGEAPGTKEGGIVEHPTHEIEIEVAAARIPEKLQISINELHLGGSISAADLELPEGAVLKSDPEATIAICSEPAAEAEEEVAVSESAEPEVIGQKKEDEEAEES